MENQTESVAELYEGTGISEAGEAVPDLGDDISTTVGAEAIQTGTGEPATPSEVPAPAPRELTERERKDLLRRFYTVRHERLTNCGHKFVPTAPPRNNCENCWWTFFQTHPALVETTDKFWQEFGKAALIGMRGEKYVKMFGRFMATVIQLQHEQEALKVGNQNTEPGSTDGTEGTEEGNSVLVATIDEGGEVESSDFSLDLLEQDVRSTGAAEVR